MRPPQPQSRAASRPARSWQGRLALGVLTLLLSGCQPSVTSEAPNIIVVSTDTVRRDAFFSRATAVVPPNLQSLAQDSILLTNAYSTIPFTLPAHMSLMTGHHHAVHGVVNDKSVLNPSLATLPELLSAAGYATAGIYTTEWLDPAFGFGRGFDAYEKVRHQPRYADRVIQRAFGMIDEDLANRQPFFLFLHLFDAHSDFGNQSKSRLPYHSPPSYREDLAPELETRFCIDDKKDCATTFLVAADQGRVEVSPADAEMLKTLYTRGVDCLDDDLAALFNGLKARGLYRESMIVVLSDHGEEFQEHGRLLHSQVYEETVGIPVIVKLPQNRGAGRRVEGLTTLMSVHRMIAEVSESLREGRQVDLVDVARQAQPSVLLQDKLRHDTWGLRSGQWKLIKNPVDRSLELYQLDQDAGETRNLAEEHPQTVQDLAGQLDKEKARLLDMGAQLAADEPEETDVLDPEERRRLEALGYVD